MKLKNMLAFLAALLVVGMVSLANAGDPLIPYDSGHWHDPAWEHQGVNVTAWPETEARAGGAIFVWYTYLPGGPDQAWLISDVAEDQDEFVDLFISAGAFPGFLAELETAGKARLYRTANGLRLDYVLPVFGGPDCSPEVRPSPLPPDCRGTLRLRRLTPPVTGPTQ